MDRGHREIISRAWNCQPAGGDQHAFIYSGGVMLDLNSLLNSNAAGWELQYASGINAAGQIVGFGTLNGGQDAHAFLLTPAVAGDANGDGIVNGLDVSVVASNWMATGKNITGDINGDGVVKPEPGTSLHAPRTIRKASHNPR
jgi:probable HAF family extracellular repeat protein